MDIRSIYIVLLTSRYFDKCKSHLSEKPTRVDNSDIQPVDNSDIQHVDNSDIQHVDNSDIQQVDNSDIQHKSIIW